MSWITDLLGLSRPEAPALPGPVETRADSGGSVTNPITGLGGGLDKGASARPNPYVLALSDRELRALHAYNGMARRIVELPPSRATRRGWSCPDIPPAEDKRLRTWARAAEAMTMARLLGGSAVLMVTEDDVPAGIRSRPWDWLREPLDLQRIGQLHALHVFDASEAVPMAWESSLASPGWRLPSMWHLTSSTTGWTATVHASRVLHFRGARRPPSELQSAWSKPNQMPDDSVLQSVWDEIRRLSETMQGGAVLAQELRESVLKVAGLANKLAGNEAAQVQARVSFMARTRSLLNMVLIGENDEYITKSSPPTGFKDLSESAQAMLATALGWPRSMLTGEAPGGLSTDDASGLERERQIISDYQEQHREPLEALYAVVYAAQDGPTRGQVPDEWELTFAPLDEPKEKEQAELRKLVAETDAIYLDRGVYGPDSVLNSRFSDGWSLDMEPITEVPDDAAVQAAVERELAAQPRGDAAVPGAVCILVPAAAADTDLAAAVERAIGQPLTREREPHVTVLHLGQVDELAVPEVVGAATETVERFAPAVIERGVVRAFPPGPNGTPIVVEFEDGWRLHDLNEQLLRRLAHLVQARQHPRYHAHLTLGYAAAPLDGPALARLLEVDASAVRVPVVQLQVMVGGVSAATVPVGG